MAKVQLNQIPRGNKIALVLNYTFGGKRKQESTKLYLLIGKSKEVKDVNKETLKKAEQLRAEKELKLAQDKIADKTPKLLDYYDTIYKRRRMSGNFAYNTCLKWLHTRKKLVAYLNQIGKSDMLVSDITIDFLEGFRLYVSENNRNGNKVRQMKASSVNVYTSRIKTILRYAVAEEYVKPSVSAYNIKVKETTKEVDYLTTEECGKVMKGSFRFRWIDLGAKIGLLTGFRISDIKQLSWEHIKQDTIELTTTKTKYKAVIPISTPLRKVLNECQKLYGNNGKVLNELTKRQNVALRLFKEYLESLDVSAKGRGWHILRKSFCVNLLNSGVPIYVASKLMTHTSISTIQHYENCKTETLVDAVHKAFG